MNSFFKSDVYLLKVYRLCTLGAKQLFHLLEFCFCLHAGCCVGSGVLPKGPVDVILGNTLTLNILHTKTPGDILIWAFSDGKDLNNVNVVTLRPNGAKVSAAYEGRASVNSTNGYLTINSVKVEDSGDYSLTILTEEANTLTGEIEVRVLGESLLFFLFVYLYCYKSAVSVLCLFSLTLASRQDVNVRLIASCRSSCHT